jgi:hypothetical protein
VPNPWTNHHKVSLLTLYAVSGSDTNCRFFVVA